MLHYTENKGNLLFGGLIILTIVTYFAGAYLGIQNFGFTILFPVLFIVSFIHDKNTLGLNNNEILMFLIFVILCISVVYYPDFQFERFKVDFPKAVVAFVGAYIAIGINKSKNYENYFHIGFIGAFFLLTFSEHLSGNFNIYKFYSPVGSRGVFTYNANYYSYMGLFANFSIFFLHTTYKNRFTLLGLLVVPLLGIAMSFTTQSRSGLLFIIFVNVIYWFWINNQKKKNSVRIVIRWFFLLAAALFLASKFISIYSQSTIKERMDTDGGRSYLMERAFDVFMDYPFLGVGYGNFVKHNKFGLFSHSSYSEALAEHGIFIGIFVLLIFLIPSFKSFRLLFKSRESTMIRINSLFFLTFILYNNVYVFYKTSFAMMYFFLMINIYYKLENELRNEQN